ncbi:ABC transporter ATP-binding protein [Aestuariibacter sp. A3R04]|uniref:ABC transporter ATP-binding protein n=1 Tax=Aestuariibacter sp. A3R04 TaxID=2841571 RepID=UPI001C09108E|nr:ABC transporter ATP-binding protein [Aestuariibacter sp. A3R04]MBU3021826.1 ABC transporter ATP-binding protein [Aestuariibacter sp. A3R04]
MIQVKHLERRYGKFRAVNDVSFNIARGEIVGLLGHNGAGKTSIMKMLTGYLEPTAGIIQVDGLAIGKQTKEIQKKMGYLPENCPVWPEMTVIDYLDYQAALHNIPPTKRTAAIAKAIARTALKDKATAPIQTLSRGYRQRVGVAQAILHEPEIVILDEPTNGLDPTQIRHMRTLIQELAKTATVIVSTHILQEVQAVCERVLILRGGRLVVDAKLAELQKEDALLLTVSQDMKQKLLSLPKVKDVTVLPAPPKRIRYRVVADPDISPAIARAVIDAGHQLYELTGERHDLETLFAQINEEVHHG